MSNFMVSRMLMMETARYDDLYLRPYETQYDQQISNILQESTEGGQRISPESLSFAAGSFLRPSSNHMGRANLANGFGEKRFSFMMEVRNQSGNMFAGGTRYVITGYTDHLGVTNLGRGQHLDPNMKFYLNNVFELRDTQVPGPNGVEMVTNVSRSNHVLHNQGESDYMTPQSPQWTLRPEDVACEIEYHDQLGGDVVNAAATLSGVRISDRRHESRPMYLTQTIQSFNEASMDSDVYDGEGYDGTQVDNRWGYAREKLRNPPFSMNGFLQSIMASTSYKYQGYMTYMEMCRLLPDLDQVAEVVLASPARQSQEYQPGQGENWASITTETIASTILQQMTPSIMSDCLLTQIGFVATNDTIGCQDDVRVYNAKGFTEGIDYSKYIDYFIARLKREVLSDISQYGAVSYNVEVQIDMLYDSYFKVSLNGGPLIYYTAPSFCDGLYAPVVSGNHQSLENMASDIATMVENLGGGLDRMMPASNRGGSNHGPASNMPIVTGDSSL